MEFKLSFSRKKKEPIPVLTDRDKQWFQFIRALGINTPNEFWNFLYPNESNTTNKITKDNGRDCHALLLGN